MKIWRLEVDFGEFESYKLANENRDYLKSFEEKIYASQPARESLEGDEIELIEGQVKGDFPKFWSFTGIPMLSENSKQVLADNLSSDTELISLKSKDSDFYLVNVLTVLDALDYDKVVLETLDTGLAVGVESYAFKYELLQGHDIFKVYLNAKIMVTEVFVSNDFKDKVEKNDLKGFKFTEVWNY